MLEVCPEYCSDGQPIRSVQSGHILIISSLQPVLWCSLYCGQGGEKGTRKVDADGGVIIGPRNFTTIPMKRGKVGKLTSFGGPVPYVADPYDNKKKIAWAELKAHQALVQEKPFS